MTVEVNDDDSEPHVARREQLIELASEQLGLTLANDPDGPVTWLGNKKGVTHGVIDLVWVVRPHVSSHTARCYTP